MSSTPNWSLFIQESWGGGVETSGFPWPFPSSNVVVGTNPPFTACDFLSIYPQFGGTPLVLTGTITASSLVVTNLSTTAGILPGMPISAVIPYTDPITQQVQSIAGPFPNGTQVVSVDSSTQITVSNPAMVTADQIAIYNSPLVPFIVINAYIALASACLVQMRYTDMWPLVMCLFIAHYCTLWARTSGTPVGNSAQLASAGLARGIQISKAAGGVSVGIQPVTNGYESWGAWGETEFGAQLLPIFAANGSGCMWLYG